MKLIELLKRLPKTENGKQIRKIIANYNKLRRTRSTRHIKNSKARKQYVWVYNNYYYDLTDLTDWRHEQSICFLPGIGFTRQTIISYIIDNYKLDEEKKYGGHDRYVHRDKWKKLYEDAVKHGLHN